MAEPVQIQVVVDPSGSITGFQAIGSAGDAMATKVVSAAEAAALALNNQSQTALKGASAIAVLTAQWEAEQAAVASVTQSTVALTTAQTAAATAARATASVFQGMTSDQTRANVAGRLLEQTFGLQNRALNQVAARSQILGPLMAAAFPLAIFAGAVPLIEKIGSAIIDITDDWGGYTAAVKQVQQETIKASQDAFDNPKTVQFAREHSDQLLVQLKSFHDQTEAAQKQLDISIQQNAATGDEQGMEFEIYATQGKIAQLEEQRGAKQNELNGLLAVQSKLIDEYVNKAQNAANLTGLTGFAKIAEEQRQALETAQKTIGNSTSPDPTVQRGYAAINQKFDAQRLELQKQMAMETMQVNDQVTENALNGIAKIRQAETDNVKELKAQLVQKLGLSQAEVEQTGVYQSKIKEIHQQANKDVLQQQRQTAAALAAIQDQTRDTFLTGDDLIYAHQEEAVSKARAEYEKAPNAAAWEKYQAEIVLADAKAQQELTAAHQAQADSDQRLLDQRTLVVQKAAEQQRDAEQAAALAMVPPWQRAYAQIAVEENKRLLQIDQNQRTLDERYKNDAGAMAQIDSSAQAQRQQVWAETNEKIRAENQKMTEQLGSDLQSAFDDATSGNLGKRVLANFEKFFFQIVAQWILSLNIMKSTFGQLAGIGLFGPGSTGANVFGGGGTGSPISLLGTLFGSGSSSQSSQVPSFPGGALSSFTGSSATSSIAGLTAGGGLSSAIAGTASTTGSLGLPTASSALTSATLAQSLSLPGLAGGAAGSSVASSAGAKSGLFGNLLSAPGLASIAGLGLALTGGALGGKTGQAGALLMSLLLSGKLGGVVSSLYGGLGLAGSGALVGGAVGGLLGFGVGQNSGGLLGSLAGAGSGALTGFMVGGPIGAVVGGIIGLLGGIFGGIFGGSKRKAQANDYANNTVIPDITQIQQGFDSFQIDPASAIQQLEQLRTDSQKQLATLKSQGKDVFNNTVGPAIDAAEKHINDINAQRTARAAVTFGPPQFDTGGMFSVSGNAGLAVLHNGEFVVNPTATKKNLPALASMNAGGSGGLSIGGDLHLKIETSSLNEKYVRGPKFRKHILDALRQAQNEGLIG
jgi:hypothetical protein